MFLIQKHLVHFFLFFLQKGNGNFKRCGDWRDRSSCPPRFCPWQTSLSSSGGSKKEKLRKKEEVKKKKREEKRARNREKRKKKERKRRENKQKIKQRGGFISPAGFSCIGGPYGSQKNIRIFFSLFFLSLFPLPLFFSLSVLFPKKTATFKIMISPLSSLLSLSLSPLSSLSPSLLSLSPLFFFSLLFIYFFFQKRDLCD